MQLTTSIAFFAMASLQLLVSASPVVVADSTAALSVRDVIPADNLGSDPNSDTHCGTVYYGSIGSGTYPAIRSCATFVTKWRDSNGERYRFTFESFNLTVSVQDHLLESRWGIDFYYKSNDNSGLSANWQCWKDDSGVWTFDISEVIGPAGQTQITRAVNTVLVKGQGGDDGTTDAIGYCFPSLGCY